MNNVFNAWISTYSIFKVDFVHNKWLKWFEFELMSLINCMDAIKIYFKSGWFYCIDVKYHIKSHTSYNNMQNSKATRSHFLNLPFGVFGTKSRVLSLHRTYWSVPSIQMYVARILFSGKSNVKYRSKTFLLINALGDDSSVLDIWW